MVTSTETAGKDRTHNADVALLQQVVIWGSGVLGGKPSRMNAPVLGSNTSMHMQPAPWIVGHNAGQVLGKLPGLLFLHGNHVLRPPCPPCPLCTLQTSPLLMQGPAKTC